MRSEPVYKIVSNKDYKKENMKVISFMLFKELATTKHFFLQVYNSSFLWSDQENDVYGNLKREEDILLFQRLKSLLKIVVLYAFMIVVLANVYYGHYLLSAFLYMS